MDEIIKKAQDMPKFKTDPYTEELFQKIKEGNLTIEPVIWSMFTHVLGNRTYVISLILGDFLSIPKWILKTCSLMMKFLYRISGHKDKLNTIEEYLEKALSNTYQIKHFLNRLRDATERKSGFK